MKGKLIVLAMLLTLLLGSGCPGPSPGGKAGAEREAPPADGWLQVERPGFQLREAPGHEAKPVRELLPGERALSLGQQSVSSSRLELEGGVYNEPWLLVRMEDGPEGWVYGLAFLGPLARQGLPPVVRLRALFGPALAEQAGLYREAFQQARSAEEIAQAMAMGRHLRDSLVEALALHALENDDRENLFWLDEAIPAFVPHLMEDGHTYYLFMDYRPFLSRAQASEGTADDTFLELCLAAYPEDSIEYFYPAWVFQSDENEVHSLLGRGLHFLILEKLDKLLPHSGLFDEEIGRFRQLLLNDITGAGVTYWESREKAAAEIDSILEAGFRVLRTDGREALKLRRLQFEDPEKYGLRFNYRSGIYE